MPASDRDRVEGWLAEGRLLRPIEPDGAGPPTTVDLARAVAHIGGAPLGGDDHAAAALAERIGVDRPLLFVLVDGLGDVFVDRLEATSVLGGAERIGLRSVFPSTTAAALTAIATGEWPATHAVPTWFTHLHRREITATILPFVERGSNTALQRFGVTPDEAFPCPSRLAAMPGPLRTYHPRAISNSEFTSYGRGGWPTDPYDHLRDAAAGVVERIAEQSERGVHYLYLPMVDSASHRVGPDGGDTEQALRAVDRAIGAIAEALDGQARIAISADHGAIGVGAQEKSLMLPDDSILDELHTPPHGEPRVPMFCVRRGRGEAFAGAFRERWGERWALLSRAEAEELALFGPGPLSELAAERIGDYIGISAGREIIVYGEPGNPQISLRGFHAGMLPEEMSIPLLLL